MKITQILEAQYQGGGVDRLVKQLRQRIGTEELYCDWIDAQDIEDYEETGYDPDEYQIQDGEVYKKVSPDEIVWVDGKQVMFSISQDFYSDGSELTKEWAKKGYQEDKDFEWYIGYGDDLPNSLAIKNLDMLFDQDVVGEIIDAAGANCYT